MTAWFRKRRQEHLDDAAQRQNTVEVLVKHRKSIKRVQSTLQKADETLGDEIRRLDSVLEGHH